MYMIVCIREGNQYELFVRVKFTKYKGEAKEYGKYRLWGFLNPIQGCDPKYDYE